MDQPWENIPTPCIYIPILCLPTLAGFCAVPSCLSSTGERGTNKMAKDLGSELGQISYIRGTKRDGSFFLFVFFFSMKGEKIQGWEKSVAVPWALGRWFSLVEFWGVLSLTHNHSDASSGLSAEICLSQSEGTAQSPGAGRVHSASLMTVMMNHFRHRGIEKWFLLKRSNFAGTFFAHILNAREKRI